MATPFYLPYPGLAAIAAILFAVFLYLFLRERRDPNRGRGMAVSLTLAVVFAVATGGLAVASYQEYVQMNTWTYFYELDVQPNSTSTQAVIVPIPGDVSLLADLHLVSGEANWSYTDTAHGRGLYVQFTGPAEIDSVFSQFSPSGVSHNTTLTMTETNATTLFTYPRHWIFYSGGSGVALHFQPGGLVTNGTPVLAAGWQPYLLSPIPDPP